MSVVKNFNGITLISLIITIIILLILAGVSIIMFNDSLIMDKADLARVKMKEASIKENNEIRKSELQIVEYANITVNLKGNVKVGEYIDYPIEYDDAYTKIHYNSSNGWRVIDDGIMPGTSGSVKIISSHIPIKFLYYPAGYNNNVDNAIYDLTTNFANKSFNWGATRNKVNGSYFNVSNLSKGITTLTIEELNNAYNLMNGTYRALNSIDELNEYDDLFKLTGPAQYYWIASKPQDNNIDMYCMSEHGIMSDSEMRFGVRPVVILNDDLGGEYKNGFWKIN